MNRVALIIFTLDQHVTQSKKENLVRVRFPLSSRITITHFEFRMGDSPIHKYTREFKEKYMKKMYSGKWQELSSVHVAFVSSQQCRSYLLQCRALYCYWSVHHRQRNKNKENKSSSEVNISTYVICRFFIHQFPCRHKFIALKPITLQA